MNWQSVDKQVLPKHSGMKILVANDEYVEVAYYDEFYDEAGCGYNPNYAPFVTSEGVFELYYGPITHWLPIVMPDGQAQG